MATRSEPAGAIFDLGYKGYTGPRLGRRYALSSLYWYSLRGCFGIGRKLSSKFFPFGIAALVTAPALLQVGIAAVAPVHFTLVKPENYFGLVQVMLALFCATVAPELLTRDRRNHTLPLYFSRALQRNDYAVAKVAALSTALFLVAFLPQALLFVGNALGSNDFIGAIFDNAGQVPPILASAAISAIFMASISLAVTAQTHRKAYATAGVLATFIVLTVLTGIIDHTATGAVQRYFNLIDPFTLLEGTIFWLFGATPDATRNAGIAHLPGYLYLAVIAVATGSLLTILLRRYARLAA